MRHVHTAAAIPVPPIARHGSPTHAPRRRSGHRDRILVVRRIDRTILKVIPRDRLGSSRGGAAQGHHWSLDSCVREEGHCQLAVAIRGQ